MLFATPIVAVLAITRAAYAWNFPIQARSNSSDSWDLKNFTSFVVFGDSYTDESRLGYFASHNGSAPPVGWIEPEVS